MNLLYVFFEYYILENNLLNKFSNYFLSTLVRAQKLEMTNNEDAKDHLVIATKSQKIQLKNVL